MKTGKRIGVGISQDGRWTHRARSAVGVVSAVAVGVGIILVGVAAAEPPAQPDWDSLQNTWKQEYSNKFQPTTIGNEYDVLLLTGQRLRAKLLSVERDSITMQRGSRQASFPRDKLDMRSRARFFQRDYADYCATKRLEKEQRKHELEKDYSQRRQMGRLANEYASVAGRLQSSRLHAFLKVSQVLGESSLCYMDGHEQPIIVHGIGKNLVDGDSWRGTIHPAGMQTYTTVMGASKKVRAYTIIPPDSIPVLKKRLEEIDREMNELRSR